MQARQTFWYDAPKDDAHSAVFEHVRGVEHEQSHFHEQNYELARLYSNREEPGFRNANGQYRSGWLGVTENVIQSVVDTATSLIGKNRARVRVLTDGADWDMQQLAKRLDKYIWGMFQGLRVHQKMSLVFRDACVFGTGCLKFFVKDGDIKCERVCIDEIIVDESEVTAGGMPLSLHQQRLVSRDKLKQMFPDKATEIDMSGENDTKTDVGRQVDPDMVLVIESWYLGADGRHTMVTDSATLLDEEYERSWFPFVFYHWSPPLTGFYGQGLAEGLLGHQIRLNDLNDFIQKAQDLVAHPMVFVEAGSHMLKMQLTNEIAKIIPYVGQRPEFFTPTALKAEIYNYKEQIKSSAFEFAGISKMAAQAIRPQGIEAGVALRELSDNQSQRFSVNQQRYEDAQLRCGEIILELAKEMAEGDGKPPTVFLADKFVETIDWPKVDVAKEKMVLQIQAASILSNTPSGRLAQVVELQQYGVPIPPAVLLRLLNLPDLEEHTKEQSASEEHTRWTIGVLADPDKPMPMPHAFQDLQSAIPAVNAALLNAEMVEAPEPILERYRNWLGFARHELEKLSQPDPNAMPPQDPAALAAPQELEPQLAI